MNYKFNRIEDRVYEVTTYFKTYKVIETFDLDNKQVTTKKLPIEE